MLVTSKIFIKKIAVETKLTEHSNIRDQIDSIERLWTKLKYGIKNNDETVVYLSLFFFYYKVEGITCAFWRVYSYWFNGLKNKLTKI